MTKTRIEVNICLQSPGKRAGDALLRWSDDARPLGVYPVPIACIVGRPGPTALLTAGVHGDEFEGRYEPVGFGGTIQQSGESNQRLKGRFITR